VIIAHIILDMIEGRGHGQLGRDKSGAINRAPTVGDVNAARTGLNYGGSALFLRLFLAGAIISVMFPIEGISSAHLVFTDGHSLLAARDSCDR
jgi:hypothetical protein